MEAYGDYWKNRNRVNFTSKLNGTVLDIIISNASLPLDSSFSMIVNNGQGLSLIRVRDVSNNALTFVQDNWGVNSKILYLKAENLIGIKEIAGGKKNGDVGFTVSALPNPFSGYIKFSTTHNVSPNVINAVVKCNANR